MIKNKKFTISIYVGILIYALSYFLSSKYKGRFAVTDVPSFIVLLFFIIGLCVVVRFVIRKFFKLDW